MTDPDLRRWLSRQVRGTVGHVPAQIVRGGAARVAEALGAQGALGHRLIVADAICDDDLLALGAAAADLPLVTGGSGIALGLPGNFAAGGLLAGGAGGWRGEAGPVVALSGSCSRATRAQIARHAMQHPVREVTADAIIDGQVTPEELADWALAAPGVPLIYSSADPGTVAAAQARHGAARVAAAIESFLAALADLAVRGGARRLISAGGETSGAVVQGLGLSALDIGPEIDPGVPLIRATDGLVLALKSGNFGTEDFFEKAARRMEAGA